MWGKMIQACKDSKDIKNLFEIVFVLLRIYFWFVSEVTSDSFLPLSQNVPTPLLF